MHSYLKVAAHELKKTRALHGPQSLHLLQELRSLFAVEHAEHLHRVQLPGFHVLFESDGRVEKANGE